MGDNSLESRVPSNPYWRIRDTSNHALVGKLIDTREKVDGDLGGTKLEIVDVIRSKSDVWLKGTIMEFPLHITGEPGDLFGLYTSTPKTDMWLPPEPLNQTIVANVKAIPMDAEGRLRFFFQEIESKDATVAYDAYDGLQQTPIKQFMALRGRLPITQLRNRLLSFAIGPFDEEPADKYSFYDEMGSGLLVTLARIVGACGNEEDAAAMEKHIRKQPCFRRDALIAAYIVLRGETGMARLEQNIKDERVAGLGTAWDVLDLLAATELLCLYEENPIPRQRAIDLAVSSLANPETAAGAIHALATWKDWKVIGRISEMFGPSLSKDAATQRAIVFYLISCSEDEKSPVAATAKQQQAFYKEKHPEVFGAAENHYGSRGAVWRKRLSIESGSRPHR